MHPGDRCGSLGERRGICLGVPPGARRPPGGVEASAAPRGCRARCSRRFWSGSINCGRYLARVER
jgi:hypothetical protein